MAAIKEVSILDSCRPVMLDQLSITAPELFIASGFHRFSSILQDMYKLNFQTKRR